MAYNMIKSARASRGDIIIFFNVFLCHIAYNKNVTNSFFFLSRRAHNANRKHMCSLKYLRFSFSRSHIINMEKKNMFNCVVVDGFFLL